MFEIDSPSEIIEPVPTALRNGDSCFMMSPKFDPVCTTGARR
jgi:hypothetical protein